MRINPSIQSCFLTLAAVVCVTAQSSRQTVRPKLSVNGARPVAMAAEMLEKTYGWVITYEDPLYENEIDLADVTQEVRRDLDKFKPGEAPKVFVPKGGSLAFEYDIDPETKKPADAGAVVQEMLEAYAIAGNPGIFHLDRDTERVHIIAGASKNKDGVLVSRPSVFDASITIPPQKRIALQLLEAFCRAVSAASGMQVRLASAPLNLVHQYQTEVGAKNQKARDFLTQELNRMTDHANLSWQLLYDPTSKAYFLNIHAV